MSALPPRLTVEGLAEKFLTDYVYLKQLRAARRYELAIRTHIVEGVGRVLADLLTRDQVRGLMKKVMVRTPSTGQGKSRPRWDGSSENHDGRAPEDD